MDKKVIVVDTKTKKQFKVTELEAKVLMKNRAGRYGLVTGVEDIEEEKETEVEEVDGKMEDAMPAKEVEEKMEAKKPPAKKAPAKKAPRKATAK